ncbi:MAG: hypothetical protein AAGB00_09960 [Planctomycetota bacterium]
MSNPYESPATDSPPPAPRPTRTTRCPHCGDAAVSLFVKSRMEPFRSRECRACGERVGIAWRSAGVSALVGLVFPVGFALALYAGGAELPAVEPLLTGAGGYALLGVGVGLALLGGAIQVAVQTIGSPLVKK